MEIELDRISQAHGSGNHEDCLARARTLKRSMLAAEPPDPLLYGWVRFYEFKSLYALGRHEEAFSLLESAEPVRYAMPQKNAAFVSSVGSELAMHLGRPDDVVKHGRRCLELRRQSGDLVGLAQCASTVCHLLERLECEDLNSEFAGALLDLADATGAERPLLTGTKALLANAAKSRDLGVRRRLTSLVPKLRVLHADEWSDAAIDLAARIARADWYLDMLDEPERAALLRERLLWENSRSGDAGAVAALLDEGVAVDARDPMDRTALVHAAFAGHIDVVRLLLTRGASVHAENSQRRTALVLAADQGHTPIVALLLEHGADPDHAGIFDQTALIVAGWQGYHETVRVLLAAGADPELADASGNTALMLTATEDQPETIRTLLAGGACIDARSPRGHTALMKAAMEGQTAVVRILLEHGANPKLVDENEMTAADWATQEGFSELAELIS